MKKDKTVLERMQRGKQGGQRQNPQGVYLRGEHSVSLSKVRQRGKAEPGRDYITDATEVAFQGMSGEQPKAASECD